MTSHAPIRLLALVLVAVVASTSCSATETVIVSDGVIASATASARASVPAPATPAPSTSDESGADDTAPTATSEPVEADTSNKSGTVSGAGDPGCNYAGVDSFGDMQIELVFTNPLDEQSDATVAYEVLDGSSEVLTSSFHFMEELKPDESVRIMVDTVTDEPAGSDAANITCTIEGIEASSFAFQAFAPRPGDRCTFAELDEFDDIQVQIDVVSPLDSAGELAVDFALRGPDGIRFEDSVAFTESVGAGQLSSTSADTFTEFPAWVTEATFTCEVLSIQEF